MSVDEFLELEKESMSGYQLISIVKKDGSRRHGVYVTTTGRGIQIWWREHEEIETVTFEEAVEVIIISHDRIAKVLNSFEKVRDAQEDFDYAIRHTFEICGLIR